MDSSVDVNFINNVSLIYGQLVRVFGRKGRDAVLKRVEIDPAEEPPRWSLEARLDDLGIPGACCWQVLEVRLRTRQTPGEGATEIEIAEEVVPSIGTLDGFQDVRHEIGGQRVDDRQQLE